jgi:CIC family chloride channel protein
MTSVFMIVEISGDYSVVLPVIISNTIAYLISRRFQHTPLFEVISEQDGVILPSMEEQRELPVQRVEDAMRPADTVLPGRTTVLDALGDIRGSHAEHFLVALDGGGWASVSRSTLAAVDAVGRGGVALSEVAVLEGPLPALHPDQPLDAALRVIHDRALLPVVHRANARHLVGVLSLNDILSAYNRTAAV